MANTSNIMSNTCILGDCLEKMKDIPEIHYFGSDSFKYDTVGK